MTLPQKVLRIKIFLPIQNHISVQFSRSVVSDSATPWIAARQASLSITNSPNSLKLMSIESVMPSSHLILCRHLFLLPSIPPSFRVFPNESTLHIGKNTALTTWNFVGKVTSLLFNMLSKLVITFLPRSKHLLFSRLQWPSAVILEPKKIKPDTVCTVSPSISHEWCDLMPWSSFSECWALSQLFHTPLSLSSRGFLVPLHFLP